MKSLHNYISEKLVINKEYECSNSIIKVLDRLDKNKMGPTAYDGWGFNSSNEGYKEAFEEIKKIIDGESIKELSCKTDPKDMKDLLKKGKAIVSFHYAINSGAPVLSFIAMWESFSMYPYIEINFVLYDKELRVVTFPQDRLLGHGYDCEYHYIVPKEMYMELIEYVHENDNAVGADNKFREFDEIYAGLKKNLK